MKNNDMKNQSLQKKLNHWIIISIAAFSILSAVISSIISFLEAKETQDQNLVQIGDFIKQGELSSGITNGKDSDSTLIIQCLQQNCKKQLAIPININNGFHTLTIENIQWRVLILTSNKNSSPDYVVAQPTEVRNEIAMDTALLSFFVVITLTPFLLGLVNFIIRYNFKPINQLSKDINNRAESDLSSLDQNNIPQELLPFIESINQLFERTGLVLSQQKRFVADAAHALRTPLTALSLLNENAIQSINQKNMKEVQKRILSLRNGIKRMKVLVNQLLSLARVQGKESNKIVKVVLCTIIHEVVSDIYPLIEEKKIDLIVTVDRNVRVFDSDDSLNVLVHNALENAIKYSKNKGKIEISLTTDLNDVFLKIKDFGNGIHEDELNKVFEPFYRAKNNQNTGNGLGLAICQEIAKKLNSNIILKNHTDGGLEFILKMPLKI